MNCQEPSDCAVIRWSQANEPNLGGGDSGQFEQDLYAAVNGNDGARPISVDVGPGASPNQHPAMSYADFDIVPADNAVRAGQAACWYSCTMPPAVRAGVTSPDELDRIVEDVVAEGC